MIHTGNHRLKALILITLGLLSGFSEAIRAQTGGLQLLGIGPEPVSLSLSEAVTARSLGASVIFTNPALLSFETQASVTAAHNFWLQNSGNSHAAVVVPQRNAAWAAGVLTSSIADIEARNTAGPPSGTFDVNYYAFATSYARSFGPVSVGVTGMYLYEQLFQLSASGYAFNAGLAVTLLEDRLRAGTSLVNAGRMEVLAESRSPLPTVWKTGVWSDVAQFSISGSTEIPVVLSLSSDLNIPLNEEGNSDGVSIQQDAWVAAGIQIMVSDLLTFRAGYRTGETKRPFSTGIGLELQNLRFNYAFVPFETGFGTTHGLNLTYFFDI